MKLWTAKSSIRVCATSYRRKKALLAKYHAEDVGLPVADDYKKRAFAKPAEETEAVYLNESESTAMYNLNLEKDKRLERIRDMFLIAAYTGLRFSDVSKLGRDNVGGDTIAVKTIKTGVVVEIPIHPPFLCDECMPRRRSNGVHNEDNRA